MRRFTQSLLVGEVHAHTVSHRPGGFGRDGCSWCAATMVTGVEADRGVAAARRILVCGVTGSGRTTLAERLSAVSQMVWHSVDDLSWEPAWVAVPAAEQRCRIEAICQQPE